MKPFRLLLAALLFAAPSGVVPLAPAAGVPSTAAAAGAAAACPVCGHDCCCPEVCAKILSRRAACAARDTSCRMDTRPSALLRSGRDAEIGAPAAHLAGRPALRPSLVGRPRTASALAPGHAGRDVPTPPPRDAA